MFMQAFTPEQAATGKMENGRDVIILYVKEFSRQCQEVNQNGLNHYQYNWYHNAEKNAYVLHVSWEDKVSLAVRFDQQHFALLASMVEPKDVILTTIPITELVAKAKENKDDMFCTYAGEVWLRERFLTVLDPYNKEDLFSSYLEDSSF